MLNEALFERTQKLCGSHFKGEIRDDIIEKFANMLEVELPKSYVEFIKRFGEGGIAGSYINGVSSENYSSTLVDTEEYREKGILPKEHIVVVQGSMYGIKELICLDTSRMKDGECPAVQYKIKDDEILSVTDYAKDFWEVFNKETESIYLEKGIPREQKEACANKELPGGMGYGCCWMVVEGSSGKAIIEALVQGKTTKSEYREGLVKVGQAGIEEGLIAISATYKKQNYVFGPSVYRFFYETDQFLEMLKDLPSVFVYMTEHVSETHGFALVENGKIVRLFSYDEDEIKNIGEPLPEEIALSYHLPKNFDDVWDKVGKFTNVDEDMLVELAIEQVGIDVAQYPYKDVTIGKMK